MLNSSSFQSREPLTWRAKLPKKKQTEKPNIKKDHTYTQQQCNSQRSKQQNQNPK